jgi:hypothetical protein
MSEPLVQALPDIQILSIAGISSGSPLPASCPHPRDAGTAHKPPESSRMMAFSQA